MKRMEDGCNMRMMEVIKGRWRIESDGGNGIQENKREPTLQANSKLGLCYTPCILTLMYG